MAHTPSALILALLFVMTGATGCFDDSVGGGGGDTGDTDRPVVTDQCPNDPNKTSRGICGCGVADVDSDADGVLDCQDECPTDNRKTLAGACGCGVVDADVDGDQVADCIDLCPSDPNKSQPMVCGCGLAETDTDADGMLDCQDLCVNDPNKIAPGDCGCGNPDQDLAGASLCPGPKEICDGVDNDGDGNIDNAPGTCVSVTACPIWDDFSLSSFPTSNSWPLSSNFDFSDDYFNSGVEPSGSIYVPEINQLFVVNDDGNLLRYRVDNDASDGNGFIGLEPLNHPQTGVNTAYLLDDDDPEGITYIPGTDPLRIFIVHENAVGRPNLIQEYGFIKDSDPHTPGDQSTFNKIPGKIWRLNNIPWLVNGDGTPLDPNAGLSSITFVPTPSLGVAQGGLFYIGNEFDGRITILELTNFPAASGSGLRADPFPAATVADAVIEPPLLFGSGLTGLTYDRGTDRIYTMYRSGSRGIQVFNPNTRSFEYALDMPSEADVPEGIVLDQDCRFYISDDKDNSTGENDGDLLAYSAVSSLRGCLGDTSGADFRPPSELTAWPFATSTSASQTYPGQPFGPPGHQPSGLQYVASVDTLFMADDDRFIVPLSTALVDPNSGDLSGSAVDPDPEGIAYHSINGMLYVVSEANASIREYTFASGLSYTGKNWDVSGIQNPVADGPAGLAFVPNAAMSAGLSSSNGGLFAMGSELDGELRLIDIDLGGSSVTLRATLNKPVGLGSFNVLSALHFEEASGYLFALFRDAGAIVVYDLVGGNDPIHVISLPSGAQGGTGTEEGFSFDSACNVYLADDTVGGNAYGQVRKYPVQ